MVSLPFAAKDFGPKYCSFLMLCLPVVSTKYAKEGTSRIKINIKDFLTFLFSNSRYLSHIEVDTHLRINK